MMKSTPSDSIQRGVGDAVVGGEVVAHHLDAEVAAGVDDAPDRRLVRAAHHHDEAGAGLRHHLRLEVAAVHRLQVGDDRDDRESARAALRPRAALRRGAAACPPRASRRRRRPRCRAVSSASSRLVRSSEIWTIGDVSCVRSMRRGRIARRPSARPAAVLRGARHQPVRHHASVDPLRPDCPASRVTPAPSLWMCSTR